jgi:hypothetical protein
MKELRVLAWCFYTVGIISPTFHLLALGQAG